MGGWDFQLAIKSRGQKRYYIYWGEEGDMFSLQSKVEGKKGLICTGGRGGEELLSLQPEVEAKNQGARRDDKVVPDGSDSGGARWPPACVGLRCEADKGQGPGERQRRRLQPRCRQDPAPRTRRARGQERREKPAGAPWPARAGRGRGGLAAQEGGERKPARQGGSGRTQRLPGQRGRAGPGRGGTRHAQPRPPVPTDPSFGLPRSPPKMAPGALSTSMGGAGGGGGGGGSSSRERRRLRREGSCIERPHIDGSRPWREAGREGKGQPRQRACAHPAAPGSHVTRPWAPPARPTRGPDPGGWGQHGQRGLVIPAGEGSLVEMNEGQQRLLWLLGRQQVGDWAAQA